VTFVALALSVLVAGLLRSHADLLRGRPGRHGRPNAVPRWPTSVADVVNQPERAPLGAHGGRSHAGR
jgi:hypothetical protein